MTADAAEKVKTDPGAKVLIEEVGILGMLVDDSKVEGERVVKPHLFTLLLHSSPIYEGHRMCQELS